MKHKGLFYRTIKSVSALLTLAQHLNSMLVTLVMQCGLVRCSSTCENVYQVRFISLYKRFLLCCISYIPFLLLHKKQSAPND